MKKIIIKIITMLCIAPFNVCSAYTSKNKPIRYKHNTDIKGNEGYAYFIEHDIRVVHFPCNNKYEGKRIITAQDGLKKIALSAQEAEKAYHELAAAYDRQEKRTSCEKKGCVA